MWALCCLIIVTVFGRLLPTQLESQKGHSSPWPDLTQEPYERLSTQDIGLKPLLLTKTREKITTRAGWEKQRQDLRSAWLERLGRPPAKPEKLDAKIESLEVKPDHVRTLVSFCAEGDDRIRAYLLVPRNVKREKGVPPSSFFIPRQRKLSGNLSASVSAKNWPWR